MKEFFFEDDQITKIIMKQDCFRLYCQENEKHMFCSSYILTIIESLRALVKMYIMTKKTTKKYMTSPQNLL